MNKITIELEGGRITQLETPMPASNPEELCEWYFKPILQKLGYPLYEIDKCFDSDYIADGNNEQG